MKIINGEGLLLGRLAGEVAKGALRGEEYAIVNCEKIVISGKPELVVAREAQRRLRKGYPPKSQKLSRRPDFFVRRTIRGMLPRKKGRGIEALKRIRCYTSLPQELASKTLQTIAPAHSQKLPTRKKITVGDVCRALGGNIRT